MIRPVGVALVLSLVAIANSASAAESFLVAGKRFLVQVEGRDDYSPQIVECSQSAIGLCLRDTRGTPADNPVESTGGEALRVTFASWGITYEIARDGTGSVYRGDTKLGPFKWTLIDP